MAGVEIGPIENFSILGLGVSLCGTALDNLQVLRRVASLCGREAAEDRLSFMARGAEETLGLRRRFWTHLVGDPHHQAGEMTVVDLAVRAARAALADACVLARDVGLVLVATSTPVSMTASVSGAVGAQLGVTAACIDTRAGCASGLFALATAAQFVSAGAPAALIIGADTFSRVIPPGHRLAALSLGDGAGAMVVGARAGSRLESAYFCSDGSLGGLVTTRGALPPTPDMIARGDYYLSGDIDELSRRLVDKYQDAVDRALRRASVTARDVDVFVPHPTSRTVIEQIRERVGFAPERTFVTVDQHANIGAGGWIVALATARDRAVVGRGTRVAVTAVGGGLSWAAAILEY